MCESLSCFRIFSQAGRTRVQVYMGIGLMGGFPSRQVPDCQEVLKGVWDYLVEGYTSTAVDTGV